MKRLSIIWVAALLLMFLAAPASAQIPVPTPTLLPQGNVNLPQITIPNGAISLWKIAPNAIQVWNMANRNGTMQFYQVAVLFLILGVGIMVIYRIISKVANEA